MAYPITEETVALNKAIIEENPFVIQMLSERGNAIYFPKKGILSQSAQAKGKGINATIGIALEDDLSPMCLSAMKADLSKISPEHIFPYSPSFGNPQLRDQWASLIRKQNPSLGDSKISLPVVTSGLTHSLSLAGFLFANPADELIIPDLYWENYDLGFGNTFGANMKTFQTFNGNSFNLGGLENNLLGTKDKMKIVLLNFPNNPSGYSPTSKEADNIAGLIKESASQGNIIVTLLDDAYYGFNYGADLEKESLFAKLATLDKRVLAVKLDAASKGYYSWGLRVGFMTFGTLGGTPALYSALENKAAGAARATNSSASTLSQNLILRALNSDSTAPELQSHYLTLNSRYEKVKQVVASPAFEEYFTTLPFNSGYFMCVKFNEGISAEKVRQTLLEKYDTGIIAWEKGNLGRIAFSSVPENKIETLFNNIALASQEVKQ